MVLSATVGVTLLHYLKKKLMDYIRLYGTKNVFKNKTKVNASGTVEMSATVGELSATMGECP